MRIFYNFNIKILFFNLSNIHRFDNIKNYSYYLEITRHNSSIQNCFRIKIFVPKMGVYWYLANLSKGRIVKENLGKFGEFDFQKEFDRLLAKYKLSTTDNYIFISDDGYAPYIRYPFRTPFPSDLFENDIDAFDESDWFDQNVDSDDIRIRINNKVLNLDEAKRMEILENWPFWDTISEKYLIDDVWISSQETINTWLKYYEHEITGELDTDKYNLAILMANSGDLSEDDTNYLKSSIANEINPTEIINHFNFFH